MKKTFAIAALMAASQAGFAALLFDVDFNNDTVGNAPSLAAYVAGTTSTKPTNLYTSGSDVATVVSSLGALTDQPLQCVNTADNNGYPNLLLRGGGVTTGTVRLEWDTLVSSHTLPTGGGAETIAAFYMKSNVGGGIFAVTLTALNTTTGTLGTVWGQPGQAYDTGANLSWTVGTVNHFQVDLNLDAAKYSVWLNGNQVATNRTLASAGFGNYSMLDIKDGAGVGGSDGTSTYGLDNILIQTVVPEPATLGLIGLGLAAWGMRRRRS